MRGADRPCGSGRRRTTASALALAVALVLLQGGGVAHARGASPPSPSACASARALPASAADGVRSARSLLCLINRERARHGLPALRPNRCLARAAASHARDMIVNGYFSHRSRDGSPFERRALATGYVPRGVRWTLGENLAWGAAPRGDPAWVLDAWLHSPSHRANVLSHAFRDAGIAAVPGAPVASSAANGAPRATYAVEFGAHDGARGRCG